MISQTKFELDNTIITKLFKSAGITDITAISPLGEGEYNAVYEVEADKTYVLKVAPHEDTPVLTYENNMLQSEVYWYSVMSEKTDIRIPKVYYSDFSRKLIPAAWFIMEKLPGQQRNKFKMSKEEIAQKECITAQMLAQLHSVRNDEFGYIQNQLFENWYLALKSMIENLISDCKISGKTTKRGERLLYYVIKNKTVFEKAECYLVNYDVWDANIMCTRENGNIQYAWIDPERSFWGDRIFDFITVDMMKPLDKKLDVINAYNKATELPLSIGHDELIRFAAAQGLMGLIQETEKYYRYTPRHFGWWRNVLLSSLMFKLAFKTFGNEK